MRQSQCNDYLRLHNPGLKCTQVTFGYGYARSTC